MRRLDFVTASVNVWVVSCRIIFVVVYVGQYGLWEMKLFLTNADQNLSCRYYSGEYNGSACGCSYRAMRNGGIYSSMFAASSKSPPCSFSRQMNSYLLVGLIFISPNFRVLFWASCLLVTQFSWCVWVLQACHSIRNNDLILHYVYEAGVLTIFYLEKASSLS